MKVLMVETGGWGGIGQYAHCLGNALIEAGCSLRLVTHERHALAYARKYPVDRVFRGDGLLADWRRLMTLCRRYRPDVVHFQSLVSTRRDGPMLWWMRRSLGRTRVALTVHNVLPHELAWGEKWSHAMIYRVVDGLIVHSRASLRRLAGFMGDGFPALASGAVEVIPHGHYGELVRGAASRRDALAALGLADARYLTCFGAIRPYKGVDWLMRAVSEVAEWPADVRVLVIGRPMAGITAESLRAMHARLGLDDRVVLRLDYVPDERIPDVFAVSDLVLLPYRDIDQSGVLMAAMAAGRPVACTPVGAFPEVVDKDIGILAPETSPEGVVRMLEEALARRDQWERMGLRARQRSERDYSWDSIARRTLDFYRRLMTGVSAEDGRT